MAEIKAYAVRVMQSKSMFETTKMISEITNTGGFREDCMCSNIGADCINMIFREKKTALKWLEKIRKAGYKTEPRILPCFVDDRYLNDAAQKKLLDQYGDDAKEMAELLGVRERSAAIMERMDSANTKLSNENGELRAEVDRLKALLKVKTDREKELLDELETFKNNSAKVINALQRNIKELEEQLDENRSD